MGNCYPVSLTSPNSNKSYFSISIVCNIWNKESHGLFDYESKCTNKTAIKASFPGVLTKNKNTLFFSKNQNVDNKNNNKVLFQISPINNGYYLDSNAFHEGNKEKWGLSQNSIWQVIKTPREFIIGSSSSGYKLSVGDYIKLGRVRFRVKCFKGNTIENFPPKDLKEEILTQGDALEEYIVLHKKKEKDSVDIGNNNSNNGIGENQEKILSQSNLNLACRICLERNESDDNPLLTPCKCAGTMKFIHLECLQKWLRGKTIVKQNPISTTIIYKSLACELCKTVFPEFLTGTGGKKYPIIEFKMPLNNYIVLEILNKDSNVPKGLHIVDMKTKQNIRIGRAHDCDLRFSDISVSRTHAIIHFSNDHFYIEDNKSKFGTLVLVRKPINLKRINPKTFSLQVENTNISFQNLQFSKNKSCCGLKHPNNENSEFNESLKTRELITLPETVNHQGVHLGPNLNIQENADMNSHEYAAHLDNHLNNTIVIQDAIHNENGAHEINLVMIPNQPLVLNQDLPQQENIDNNIVNNNVEFNFDSDNEAYFNYFSEDYREGQHQLPIIN